MGTPGNPLKDKFGRDILTPDYSPARAANDVTFALHMVAPPSPLYIQRDDQLVLEGVTSQVPDSLQITIRQLLAAPQYPGSVNLVGAGGDKQNPGTYPIITTQQTLQLPTLNTLALVTIPLVEGYLLSVSLAAGNLGATQRGVTYARVWINRGKTAIQTPNAALPLLADYVTQTHSAGWPYGRVLFPTEGPGAIATTGVAAPGAGLDQLFTVPNFSRYRIQGFALPFTTNATVVNRLVRILVRDPAANIAYQAAVTAAIPATSSVVISGAGVQNSSVTDPASIFVPLPPGLVLGGNWSIGTSTLNIQAGDQYGLMRLMVELWADGQ